MMENATVFGDHTITQHRHVLPPSALSKLGDVDYHFYVADLTNVEDTWTQDSAFVPTTITYSVTFLLGLCGNVLALFALLADVRSSRSATGLFLANLAVADIIFLLLSVPYELFAKFISQWSSGELLCKLSAYVETVAGQSSVLNLAAVSVERLVGTLYSFKP